MATGAQTWSTTAASNNSIDTSVNWAEGMAPSAVNNSARAEMASMAMWFGDNSGTIATSGSTVAYSIVSKQISTAVADGYTIAARFHAANDANATLNVDGTGAKAIHLTAGTPVAGGEFLTGSVQRFVYTASSTSWVLHNYRPSSVSSLLAADGSVGSPSHSFTNDTDCGLYRIGANNIGFTVGGGKVTDWSTAGVAITGTHTVSGAATLSSSLTVTGAALLSGTGTIAGAATMQSSLTVTGAALFSGAVSMGIASLGSSLTVANNTLLSGTLTVAGAATLQSSLTVTNAALLSGAITVAGAATMQSSMEVSKATLLSSNATITGTLTSSSINSSGAISGRIDPRLSSAASGDITPDISGADIYIRTAISAGPLAINTPIGTPLAGDKLIFRLKDDGTARALSWNAIYRAIGTNIPTTTVLSKYTYVGAIYNATDTKWDVIAVAQEA